VTHWVKLGFGLTTMVLTLLTVSCGGSSDPAAETELQARAQAMVNGMQVEVNGQFRSEAEGQRLRGELDNPNLAVGTPVSFCLVKPSGSMPLAAPQAMLASGQEVAQFELNTESGQPVPNVVVGDKFEARQGATAAGTADCGAPLLLSATFQLDVNEPK
jgi:hypothetical protein